MGARVVINGTRYNPGAAAQVPRRARTLTPSQEARKTDADLTSLICRKGRGPSEQRLSAARGRQTDATKNVRRSPRRRGRLQGSAIAERVGETKDDRWRYHSPSRIAPFYGDLGWKGAAVVGPNALNGPSLVGG